jgi:18S rRNA (guanine1575-N7)-methyltransferase
LILDLGCGSGLSGEAVAEAGHVWVGLDISRAMLEVAQRRGAESSNGSGDLVLRDLGSGVPFRPGVFDGAVSVSAVQWLCNSDAAGHNPVRRLRRFFETLFGCLKRSARAVLQCYPETPQQMEMITSAAMRAGFTGGLLVDFPNSTKAKKYYLTLFAGPPPPNYAEPEALGTGDGATFVGDREGPAAVRRNHVKGSKRKKPTKGSRAWILMKKETQRQDGVEVRHDTKYTGRKRRRAF